MAKEKTVLVEDEWGKEWELLTQLFAGDAHHYASGSMCVEGREERFEIATLWSAFFGMEHGATKFNAVVDRWGGGEWAEDKRWTDGGVEEVVRIRNLHEDIAEEVPKVATGADQRALGVQVNMEGYSKGAAEKASAEKASAGQYGGYCKGHTADAISQVIGGEMWECCGVAEVAVQTEAA